MNRKFTKLLAAFALLVGLAIPMGMWGQTRTDVTYTFSDHYSSNTILDGVNIALDDVVQATFNKREGGTATQYYTNGTAVRWYGGGTLAIVASNGTMSSITFTFGSSDGSNEITTNVGSYENGAWTGSASSVTFTQAGTSGNRRISAITVTYTTSGTPPTTYTVTFDAGDGTFVGNSDFPNVSNTMTAGTYTLPSATPASGYTFDGWTATGINTPVTGEYTVSGDVAFTASYTENTTPTGGGTATLNITEYASENNWQNDTKYTEAIVTPVTFNANGGNNTGKYYTNGNNWRFYQNESASLTISVPNGYTLVSVKPTFSVSNTGILKNGNATITSGSTVAVSGTSVTFTVGNSGTATNGQVRFTNIDVVYVSDGSSQSQSDLAITNASTDLTFDLYNNTTAQVINYTTSSTGAITITPAESSYFTYVHDATAKTITVTPTAVTPSAQTVTISQEADEDYYAGTASFTVSVANSDPNLPGTENNPYTVAQALANTPSSGTSANVYIHGIVSRFYNTSIVGDGSNYRYYISDDGTTDTELLVYKGKGLNNVAFSNADDLLVGDEVTIFGGLTTYNNTKEVAADNYIVSLVRPQSTEPSVTVSSNEFNYSASPTTDELLVRPTLTYNNVEVTNHESFDVQYCDDEGNETTKPAWVTVFIAGDVTDGFNVYCVPQPNDGAARTAYFKVYALDAETNLVYSNLVTINQAAFVVDYATLPFSFDGGKADIENTAGLTQDGIDNSDYSSSPKLKFNNTGDWLILHFNERPGVLTFDIKNNSFSGGTFKVQTSEDGVTYTDLNTYTEITGTQNEEFTNLGENVRYIKWIYTEKVQNGGNVGLGNINLASYVAPADYDLTVTLGDNIAAIYVFDASDESTQLIEDGAAGTVQVLSGTSIIVSPDVAEGYVLETLMVNNVNVISQLDESGAYTFTMPATDVTITATATEAPAPFTSTVYTRANSITSGNHYIIVGFNGEEAYAMGEQKNNNRGAVVINEYDNNATITNENVHVFVITALTGEDDGYYTIEDNGYLYAANGGNYLKTENDLTDNSKWEITFDSESGQASVVASKSNNRNVMQFNYASNNQLFSCYSSASQKPVYLYVKSSETSDPITPATNTTVVESTDFEATVPAGYHLIASPFNNINPKAVEGMLTGNYDLYYFDENGKDNGDLMEWRNYKVESFLLESGKGYLYASESGVTLSFSGVPYAGNGEVDLAYTADNRLAGWNLIGNPFATAATLNMPFYKMNELGNGFTAKIEDLTSLIVAMEGVFVQATAASQTATFTAQTRGGEKNGIARVNFDVIGAQGQVIDNAIVRFDGGQTLGKFQLRENSTKVYFTEEGRDYAIVNAEAQGEMPVNFKAAENGTYTIGVETENLEVNYLHLIDNMTGMDVDLLATPSYTFEGKKSDYASRFKLVFSANAGNNEVGEDFAFISDGNIIILHEGEATLQVIDIMGRIVNTQTVNGNASVNNVGTAGVYVLQLINGNNVKTQKIVVR